MRHKLYGIFLPNETWAMHRNGRTARRIAKGHKALLTAMPLPATRLWDAPTFRACSDVVADFRETVTVSGI